MTNRPYTASRNWWHHALAMKPIHKAICAGLAGALIAFGVASCAVAEGHFIPEHDGSLYIICSTEVEDFRPWYSALAGYIVAFTPVLLVAFGRVRSDAFRHDHPASSGHPVRSDPGVVGSFRAKAVRAGRSTMAVPVASWRCRNYFR